MTIAEDARRLGGEARGKQIYCPGPGHGPSDRSLSLEASAKSSIGYVFHSFAGDDVGECFAHIRERLGLSGISEYRAPKVAEPEPEIADDNGVAAKAIWEASVDIIGSFAETYLREARGLYLAPPVDWSRVLRFNKSLQFGKRKAPGMVALMRNAITDKPQAIQRTFLTKDGNKIARWMLGKAGGAAIKLDPSSAVTDRLHIGEGLESTLAGRAFGFGPAWTVGSAGAIASFPVIPAVADLIVFAENDAGANEKAIVECGERYAAAGKAVRALRPPAQHKDLNNEWLALPELPYADRASAFESICKQFWPGASITDERYTGPSVLDTLREIGFRAFGVRDGREP